MKLELDMPAVAECSVSECAYNDAMACHAKAITVGDGAFPGCDTFFTTPRNVHLPDDLTPGVGACKVEACRHNVDLECGAHSVAVGIRDDEVCCLTYAAS